MPFTQFLPARASCVTMQLQNQETDTDATFTIPCCFIICMEVKVKVKSLSHVHLFATPWTVAPQAPRSMEFSRHEHWSGLPFPSPGGLPDQGIEPGSPAL